MGGIVQKVNEWVRGHAWASVAIALFFGFSMGSGSKDDNGAALASARSQFVDLESEAADEAAELEAEKSDLASENEELSQQLDQVESRMDDLQDEVEFMKSEQPLPDLIGQTPNSILSLASKYDWQVSMVKQVSSATPGTIISQVPASGATVYTGSDIKVVIAKAPPAPKPQPVAAPAPQPLTGGSGCDSNYSGTCVPQVSYDLNCDDIGGSVTVVGSDPHGFDGDGDGSGCE